MQTASRFEALVSPHLQDLRGYCHYLAKSKWDAEDLMQEALLKSFVYFKDHDRYEITKMFLLRAAKLSWIDRYRRTQVRSGRMESQPEAAFDADYIEIRGIIEWMAERLSAQQMEIWLLAEYFGYSMAEIAERQRTTVSAVKSALYRTKRGIREQRFRPHPPAEGGNPASIERWVRAVLREEPRRMSM
ncbi:RNA polymerase sigma factor [Paenibacillus sp.]|uniref:RNA polymerase sigma factor n=1 Tax=Paenibacillus sp. TaxID=58172 RepID=UPI002810EFB0|nr:RNA polymerase sigma factor [Paenibacillus sp.]